MTRVMLGVVGWLVLGAVDGVRAWTWWSGEVIRGWSWGEAAGTGRFLTPVGGDVVSVLAGD